MKIARDYHIRNDENCVTLYRKKKVKNGKQAGRSYDEIIGYYPCVASAFQRLIDLEVNGCKGLELYVDKINELKQWANDLLGWKEKEWIKT